MSDKRMTARAFHAADGVGDWRVLYSGANAFFRVGSFADAARFVAAIAEVADALGHFPDVDVRPEGVTVRTASGEYGAMSQRDVELARRISAEARRLGLEPDPSQVQVVSIAVAQDADADVAPFWAAALGYRLPWDSRSTCFMIPYPCRSSVERARRAVKRWFSTLGESTTSLKALSTHCCQQSSEETRQSSSGSDSTRRMQRLWFVSVLVGIGIARLVVAPMAPGGCASRHAVASS